MKPWTITLGDRSWTDSDAKAAHAVAVAELIGDSWDAVSPWSGPKSLAAWVAVLAASDGGDLTASVTAVYGLSVSELTDCLSDRDVDAPNAFPPPVV